MKSSVFAGIENWTIPSVKARWVGTKEIPCLHRDREITEVKVVGLTLGGLVLQGACQGKTVRTIVPSDWFFYWVLREKAKTNKACAKELSRTVGRTITESATYTAWMLETDGGLAEWTIEE